MAENGIDYGMTPQGFIPKRLAHIVEDINTNMSFIIDPGTGERMFQNLSDDSILQQIIGVFAEGLSECWETAYDASVQFDPLKNSGAGQAGTVQLNAMLLKPGGYTVVEMDLYGAPGTLIPAGSRISAGGGGQAYATQQDAILGSTGWATTRAECLQKGPFAPEPETVIQIQTPVSGWRNAANTVTIVVGSAPETEEEARVRQQRSTSLTSYRQIDAIYAAVRNIPGVIYCRAYQNDKVYPADSRGIPFKEVAVVAEGGDPREIANALFLRFPVGVTGYGNTQEVLYDHQGVSHIIGFSRPTDIPVTVEMDIAITTRGDYPNFGAQEIRDAIVAYARYGGEGNETGFAPGVDITRSRLYTPINRVPGHKVTRLQIGVVGIPVGDDDIPISWNQVGRFDLERIIINVTAAEDTN